MRTAWLTTRSRSRLIRAAAAVPGATEKAAAALLADARVTIELELAGDDDVVALLAAVRQALLIWRRVAVVLPLEPRRLGDLCREIAMEIRPGEDAIEIRRGSSLHAG